MELSLLSTIKNKLARELLNCRQPMCEWQSINLGSNSARQVKQAVIQYQQECPYDKVSIRYTSDGSATVVIEQDKWGIAVDNKLIKPNELRQSEYYSRGVNSIISDFNSQVTAMAAVGDYQDVHIECDSLLVNDVTKQLYKSGWVSSVRTSDGDMVTITVNVHKSMLRSAWEEC